MAKHCEFTLHVDCNFNQGVNEGKSQWTLET